MLEKIIHTILPQWIHQQLASNWDATGFRKYLANSGWLLIGKFFSLAVSLFMVAIVARYLGPENLGKLGYAQSFVAIFSLFASLGIAHILLRDLVKYPERESQILGTGFIIKLFFGTVTLIATASIAYFLNTDTVLTILILILSLSFIVEPFGITTHVFEARVKSKYLVISQIIAVVLIPALKLFLIFSGKGIIFFAGIILIEIVIKIILSLFFYVRIFNCSPLRWSFDWTYASELIKKSLPLLFAGVSGYLFLRIDHIMLQHTLGPTSVGLYQSSAYVTELIAHLLPGIIIASTLPALINIRKISVKKYYIRLRQLLKLVSALSFFIVIIIFVCAPFIIKILYGSDFSDSASVLRIYVWSSPLYMLVLILQHHLINHDKTKIFFMLSIATAIINIILNFLLIPTMGMHGAALASVISLIFYLILPVISPQLRSDYVSLGRE